MLVPPTHGEVGRAPSTQSSSDIDARIADILSPSVAEVEKRERHLESLQAVLEAATEPTDQAAAHLAMANWLLAVPTSYPATRWLIGIETPTDRASMVDKAEAANQHINKARTLIAATKGDDLPPAKKTIRRRLKTTANMLEPFVKLFLTLKSKEKPNEYKTACAGAALELALVREAEDAPLRACALLWQSFGWALAGRTERARLSLPDALKRPEQLPYDFFSRLVRCRLLADDHEYAAATTLLIRIRASCPEWFDKEPAGAHSQTDMRDARHRLVDLLEYLVGRVWSRELRESASESTELLDKSLDELQKSLFSENQLAYHLEPIIPIILEPPALRRPAPPSTSTSSAPGPETVTTSQSTSRPTSGK